MRLHFGGTQIAVLAAFATVALVAALVFVRVALASRREVPYERVQGVGYALRRPWFAFLVAALVVVLVVLMFELPFARGGRPVAVVNVTAGQFYFSLSRSDLPPGRVRFDVTSADVNHGFGLYDPHGRLVGSVQAMPGYTNKLTVTLVPGRYTIACLEYCGLAHHLMAGSFTVTP